MAGLVRYYAGQHKTDSSAQYALYREVEVLKVCVVVTSRAQYGRMKSVLLKLNEDKDVDLQLIVGASALLDRYGCVDVIERDGFTIHERHYCVIDGDIPGTMAQTTGILTQQLATTFGRLKPDVVLVHADRYEQLGVAIAASYMNIPVAHTQGGEETGSIDDKVRNAITMLADLHFPSTEESKKNLYRILGLSCGPIDNTGCPSIDLIPEDLSISDDVLRKYGGVGAHIDSSKPYIVVLQHPVTTEYGEGENQIQETLEAIQTIGMQTVWLWPNVDAGTDEISGVLRKFREDNPDSHIHFYKNFAPEDFYRLIYNCACLVGNTSSGIREGSYLGVPYVCVGTRQSDREHGNNVIFTDYSGEHIKRCVLFQLQKGRYKRNLLYGDGTASDKIVEILKIWRR